MSLTVHTRKVDRHGGTFATLQVMLDADGANRRALDNCFCIKRTLACMQVTESYWSIPNLGVGGRQTNVHMTVAADQSPIARLQRYHADLIRAVPVFGVSEPWARFQAVTGP